MRVEFTRENLKGLSPREGNGRGGCRNSVAAGAVCVFEGPVPLASKPPI